MTPTSDPHIDRAKTQIAAALMPDGHAPIIRSFFDEATFTASHVVHDPISKHAAIIDSVLDYDPASGRTAFSSADALVAYAEEEALIVDWLLETHAHADHLSAAPYLQQRLGGKIAIGHDIVNVQQTFGDLFNSGSNFKRDGSDFDHLFNDGDSFKIGTVDAMALHVPGHTPADLAYIIGGVVLTGDTLFMPDYGSARADFPGGNARQLYRSIQRLLLLPEDTRLLLCHDYKTPGRDEFVWETTVGEQRRSNVHIHDGVSEDEFVVMRNARDATLDMPRLILPAVQVNIRAGHMPPPEENGVRYLKIPLDAL
jgi:glyoxylase-like metal-dependent hydrolase (beta-lactamase superfamily II)